MKSLLFIFLLIFSFITYAEDTLSINVDEHKPVFTVQLPANPTTGYQWKVKSYDKNLFRLIRQNYVIPRTKRIGAGSLMRYIFMRNPGKDYPNSTTMVFTYARAWEPNNGVDKTVIVNFTTVPN